MSNINDFVINEDGALVEYIGTESEVIIPDSVKCVGIGNSVFSSENVKSVIIPKSVKSICGCAFSGCETLESITIPNSVKTIGIGAFKGTNITSISIPDSVKAIEGVTFEQCKALKEITIGKSVKKIGIRAFYGCFALENINFNGTVEQFLRISKADSWYSRTGDWVIHCTDGHITKLLDIVYY